jgi:uncharacterized membrane protein
MSQQQKKSKLENAISNTFQMIFFGMLEGLWMIFAVILVVCLIFDIMPIFWFIFIGFWGASIILNAIFNDNFWK